MPRRSAPALGLLFALLGLLVALPARARADDDALAPLLRAALVRLQVTSQGYDRNSPWQLSHENTRSSRGVVVAPGVILTKAANVAQQRMIELSLANSARLYPARLKHVDRDLGLALIAFDDPELLATLKPLPLGAPVRLDDALDIHQLGQDNIPERHDARVVRAMADHAGLSLQVKTTCSDTGDGQVALKDGALVGLVTSTFGSRQQAVLLSVETLRHYLEDFEDGTYAGPPGPRFWTYPLLREDLRTYHGLKAGQHGLAVRRVVPGRTGDGVLQAGDVLLSVDGYDLDDEGKFVHEVHGRLDGRWLLGGRRYAGEQVGVRFLRAGVEHRAKLLLRGQAPSEARIPDGYADERPQFMLVGGLVLLELSSSSNISRSPGGVILNRHRERSNWDPPGARRRIIYADRMLKDPSNKGFEDIYHQPVLTINGMAILDFGDVPKALEQPQRGFHVFRFEGLESDVVIPAAELAAIDKRITETYRIPLQRYLRE